jgi:hypothetical protein
MLSTTSGRSRDCGIDARRDWFFPPTGRTDISVKSDFMDAKYPG